MFRIYTHNIYQTRVGVHVYVDENVIFFFKGNTFILKNSKEKKPNRNQTRQTHTYFIMLYNTTHTQL